MARPSLAHFHIPAIAVAVHSLIESPSLRTFSKVSWTASERTNYRACFQTAEALNESAPRISAIAAAMPLTSTSVSLPPFSATLTINWRSIGLLCLTAVHHVVFTIPRLEEINVVLYSLIAPSQDTF
ncbi:hypothetical protein MRB53_038007 [Persea americana]|nr:hypothetical protein MRB53_038007 [Persea americana]